MLEIREEQLDAMRAAVRAGFPNALLGALQAKGIDANRDARTGAVVATDRCGHRTRLFFRDDGAPKRLILPSGQGYELSLDDQGRLAGLEHQPPGWKPGKDITARVDIDRDPDGNISAVRRAGVDEHRFTYDDAGRPASVRYPDGAVQRFEHDTGGRLVATTDRAGARTEYRHDAVGGVVVVDPLARETRFEAKAGALEAVVFPDGSSERYAFDPDRNTALLTRRDGRDVFHEIDGSGALRHINWPDGSWVDFDFDPSGNLIEARGGAEPVEWSYGQGGQPVKERSSGGVVGYDYDPEGRLTRVVTPHGETVDYRYDEDGRLCSVRDWEGREHRFEFGAEGTLREIRWGNGLVEKQRYGSSGRLTTAKVFDKRKLVSEQRYSYDVCGRVTGIEDVGAGWTRKLTLDLEGRPVAAHDSVTGRTERYVYDKKGNLVFDGADRTVGVMDELLSVGSDRLLYDILGNVVRLPSALGTIDCRWNDKGLLAESRLADRVVSYAYDSLGRRVLKTDGVRTWRYGWAGHQLLYEEYEEAPGARGLRRDYLWAPDAVTPLAFREGGRTYWLQTDTRGAVIRAFADKGRLVWSARYDDFGRAEVDVALVRQPWRMAGQYHDEETGLLYSLCRFYSSELKQYLSLDPRWHDVGTVHYGYVGNRPWDVTDPFGGMPLPLIAGALIAVGVGAVVGGIIGGITGGWKGAISGAVSGGAAVAGAIVGGLVGGPVGVVAGGMIGNVVGTFAGELLGQVATGEPVCVKCALEAAAISGLIDLALLGLGKIPGVRQLVRAIGKKLYKAGAPLRNWAKKQIARVRMRYIAKSKVGVKGTEVPDRVPRLKNMPEEQAAAQERFARMYEKDPDGVARKYNEMVKKKQVGDMDGKTYATDDAKVLSPDYNPATGTDAEKLAARGHMNLPTHNTASAVSKRAFLQRLDEIAADPNASKTVLVTGGGVGSGKSYGLKARPELKDRAGVVWDAAGEANSTEMPWVINEAKKRGLNTEVVYVHQVPDASWQNMQRGVIPRAQTSGRMVDARLHADSYAEGARNFDAVQKLYSNDPSVKFNVIDVTGKDPKLIESLPQSALNLDANAQAAKNIQFLKDQPGLSDHVTNGGYKIGDKIWGSP